MKPQYFVLILFAAALYWMYLLYAPFLLSITIAALLAISTSTRVTNYGWLSTILLNSRGLFPCTISTLRIVSAFSRNTRYGISRYLVLIPGECIPRA